MGLEGDLALYDLHKGKRKMYKYDKVFGVDSTQEEVYEDTKALIRSVLDGMIHLTETLLACKDSTALYCTLLFFNQSVGRSKTCICFSG